MKNKRPLLSICIPTFNRAKFLENSLKCFEEQLRDVDKSEIELYVSDNCSEDGTPQVVQKAIQCGLPITYNRNERNLGPDRNFLRCMQWSSGKYIWLLGDDDLLKPDAVKYILDRLRNHDYGLVHLSVLSNKKNLPEIQEYDNVEKFFMAISYWITFMSGSIFLKEAVSKVEFHEQFFTSYLLQVPFYIMSSSLRKKNLFVRKSIMQNGLDSSSNGGYNFYQVFVKNYLNIWKDFVYKDFISKKTFEYVKKDIYVNFITEFNYKFLLPHKKKSSFKTKNAWRILFSYYGMNAYFYKSICQLLLAFIWRKIRK